MSIFGFGKKKTTGTGAILETNEGRIGDALDFASKEAFTLLRENIEFVCPKTEGRGRIIGVSSPDPSEGKSYTAINLSYFLAKKGESVILVDGDMRRPSVSKSLKLEMEHGLSNMLATGRDFIVHQSVQHENMNVITCGKLPPNPAELIGNDNMGEALRFLAHRYDYVIMDLPPINIVSDAVTVSRYLDGILVVVMHGSTARKDAISAIRALQLAKAKILGIVYNGYTSGKKYYKRKGYYRSGYGYGYGYSSGYSYSYEYASPESKASEADATKDKGQS